MKISNCCGKNMENSENDVYPKCLEHCESMEEEKLTMADVMPVPCPYCGLDLDLHEGDGFCPGGTEELGGRR